MKQKTTEMANKGKGSGKRKNGTNESYWEGKGRWDYRYNINLQSHETTLYDFIIISLKF